MGNSTIAANRLIDVSPDGINGGKKGRSKACDDCRKSKRRCIHDEYGRIDPIKAQERSKPRANASAKRARPAEEGDMPASAKKAKQESTSPMTQPAAFFDHDGDEMMAQGDLMDAYDHEPFSQIDKHLPKAAEAPQNQALYASPPAFQAEPVEAKDLNSMSVSSSKPNTSLVSPPTSLVDEMDGVQEGDAVQSVEGEVSTALHTPNSSSRHSSRQPRHVDRVDKKAFITSLFFTREEELSDV
ncbi:hypothetical protein DTO013F2_10625 [Penicillium roqueforti]|nr:hypothetical protein DTO013F2_10625 [Penicillium roqueforti]